MVSTTTEIILLAVGFVDVATRQYVLNPISYNNLAIFIVPEPAFKVQKKFRVY